MIRVRSRMRLGRENLDQQSVSSIGVPRVGGAVASPKTLALPSKAFPCFGISTWGHSRRRQGASVSCQSRVNPRERTVAMPKRGGAEISRPGAFQRSSFGTLAENRGSKLKVLPGFRANLPEQGKSRRSPRREKRPLQPTGALFGEGIEL